MVLRSQNVEDNPSCNHSRHYKPRSDWQVVSLVLAISLVCAMLAWQSCSTAQPSPISPYPICVAFAVALNIPRTAIAVLAGILTFLINILLVSRNQGKHISTLGLIGLIILTATSAVSIAANWRYGIHYQGLQHMMLITIYNIVFSAVAWFAVLWWKVSQRAYVRYYIFTTVSFWISWCAVPWTGELVW